MKRRNFFTAFFSLITIPVIGKLLPKETEYVDHWVQKYDSSLSLLPTNDTGGIHYLKWNGDGTFTEIEQTEWVDLRDMEIFKDLDENFNPIKNGDLAETV